MIAELWAAYFSVWNTFWSGCTDALRNSEFQIRNSDSEIEIVSQGKEKDVLTYQFQASSWL